MKTSREVKTHLVVISINESQLESVLSGVNFQYSGSAIAVQTEHGVTSSPRDVDRKVQRTDDTVIADLFAIVGY